MRQLLMTGSALLFAGALPAQDTVRTECVGQFARHRPVAVYMGSVRSNTTIVYIVSARAGETLNVSLITSTPSNYFSIYAPGADTAMFNGPTSDKGFSGPVPVSGEYQIKVFLVGKPRPEEVAAYSLAVRITNAIAVRESAPR